jgi:hypothetical protein
MTRDEVAWYWDGVMHGLNVANVIIDRNRDAPLTVSTQEIKDRHDEIKAKRETRHRGIVDGEDEWRSWMVELEVQSWNRSENRETSDAR